ncbi:MAG: NFACT family protein [bacterium]|nr:NFACT family protein [bacterium]
MKTLSSLEIQAVVAELQKYINARVDQIYQPDATEISIALHRSDLGRNFLRIIPGTVLYITTKKRASPKESINFCRFLRKRLGSTRLKEILQKNRERIVELHFEGKESYFILIAEFFSKGNLILCDKNYTIISAFQVQLWKDRKIKAKQKYEYPPERKIDFKDFAEFKSYLESNKKESIVKTIALGLNMGGVYAEELCFRAKIAKETKDPQEKELQELFKQLQMLLSEELHPNRINGEPYPIHMHERGDGEAIESYNKALDEYYAPFMNAAEDEEQEEETEKKKNKWEDMIREQEKQKIQVEKAIEENRIKAEWIYNNYMEAKEILDLFKQKNFTELKKKGVEIEGKNLLIEIQ